MSERVEILEQSVEDAAAPEEMVHRRATGIRIGSPDCEARSAEAIPAAEYFDRTEVARDAEASRSTTHVASDVGLHLPDDVMVEST